MTPREQNLAIALFMGFKLEWSSCGEEVKVYDPKGAQVEHSKCNRRTQDEAVNDLHYCFPNYIGDLNAIAEAEKGLSSILYANDLDGIRTELNLYLTWLVRLCGHLPIAFSTAPQRAEAFLRTIGQWKESPNIA
jgi:hypothetical protein